MEKTQVPKRALYFAEQDSFKFFKEKEDDEEASFSMLAYSGNIIKNHFYWGNLLIDVNGVKLNKKSYPILLNHDTEKKIGYVDKNSIKMDGNISIGSSGFKFVSTKEAEEFKKLSKEGFPYQSSIYAVPTKIKRLEDGETVEVNGHSLSGPDATVWEECELFEASACVFGADSNTNAHAFADNKEEVSLNIIDNKKIKEVKIDMDLTKLKADHPELVAQIKLEAKAEAEAKAKTEAESQFADQITSLKEENSKRDKQIAELTKREEIRKEKDMKMEADKIWQSMFSDSGLPERLFAKITGNVSYSNFVVDDALDMDKFKDAVKAELKDWSEMGISDEVIGGGRSTRELDADKSKKDKFTKENDDAANALLAIAGIKVDK